LRRHNRSGNVFRFDFGAVARVADFHLSLDRNRATALLDCVHCLVREKLISFLRTQVLRIAAEINVRSDRVRACSETLGRSIRRSA
jgi:hypothetical protein